MKRDSGINLNRVLVMLLTLGVLLAEGAAQVAAADGSGFQQDGSGLVSMEAEHYQTSVVAPDGHAWLSAGAGFAGYSGSDAMRALPEDKVVNKTNYATLSPRLDYPVNFALTGTIYVWVRAEGPSTNSNTVHVGLDGQEVASSRNIVVPVTSGYVWSSTQANGTRATMSIGATGAHTVNVWMRDSGTVIDKVVLTTNAAFNPSTVNGGLGPNETSAGVPTVESPAISPNGGVFTNPVSVSLSTGTAGATIYYTVDGSIPTTASTPYTAPFQVAVDTTVNASAFLTGYNASEISSAVFQIQAGQIPFGVRSLGNITATTDVGEKPQSKVWQYNNDFWLILPDTTGTWVWRLNGTSWTKVLKISTDTNTKADVKLASSSTGLVHAIIQHITSITSYGPNGDAMQLVSLEYVPGPVASYKLWTTRPYLVDLPTGLNTETVTLELDANNTMWVARDFGNTVEALYSTAPYSNWSGVPVTLDYGISQDDISAITKVGSNGIGVMWSNQNLKRFGFVYHNNNDAPTNWSAVEYPGALNAKDNVGGGLADDHINFASGADGTVYAAVKTSYDSTNLATIGLFVRSPAGTWTDLIPISNSAKVTRPSVMLNELENTIDVFYSNGSGIAYTEAYVSSLVFGPEQLLVSGTNLTDASLMKQKYSNRLVMITSRTQIDQSSMTVKSVLLTK